MKRLNPETGKPFAHGSIREDGYIFKSYLLKKLNKNGYFVEMWSSPKSFDKMKKNAEKHKKYRSDWGKKNYEKIMLNTGQRASRLIVSARNRAKKNNSLITITKDWVEEKLNNGICELSGIAFDFSITKEFHSNPYAPSLDRIDAKNKNYTPENTRVVVSVLNSALNEYGISIVLPAIRAMAERRGI